MSQQSPEHDGVLAALVSRGRAAFPALTTSDETFRVYLSALFTGESAPSEQFAADLYLACACAQGEPAALSAFHAAHVETIQLSVRRAQSSEHRRADAVQLTLDRLLVRANEGQARIAQYSGRAPLSAFVRVVAVRVALSLSQGAKETRGSEDGLGELQDMHDDPEQRYLKRLYQEQFRSAFSAALESLSAYDRCLLRYQVVDGLSIEQLASVFEKTRSTMGRHVLEARARLVTETKRELRARLQVERTALSSVLRLVQSSVDVSVRRLLGNEPRQAEGL